MKEEAYQNILTLIRAGALDQATVEYEKTDFGDSADKEDILALPGRLKKSRAFEASGDIRIALALEAAECYEKAFVKTGGYYSGINTAAMYLVGGRKTDAANIAQEIISKVQEAAIKPGEDAYYALATKAEAQLILGDIARAEDDLRDAIVLDPHNYAAHATTIKQFEILLEAIGSNSDWLTEIRPPRILHYAGHMFAITDDKKADIYAIEHMVDDFLKKHNIGVAYGALAAGSDIIIAEKLLDAGVELHVILPCPLDLFEKKSLAPFGVEWHKRFDECINKAVHVRHVSNDTSVLDELNVALAEETAMGLATLRADEYATHALQLLIWDEVESGREYGTVRDAALWRKSGRDQYIVPFKPPKRERDEEKKLLSHDESRSLKALIFSDVKEFSDLNESQVTAFFEYVMKPLLLITERRKNQISQMNTSGCSLFLAFNSIVDAAETALELQSCLSSIDFADHNLPEGIALRVGAHYGPTIPSQDPFLNKKGVSGTQVSLVTSIMSVASPGSICVSEAFACAIAVSSCHKLRCEYLSDEHVLEGDEMIKLFALRRKGNFIS